MSHRVAVYANEVHGRLICIPCRSGGGNGEEGVGRWAGRRRRECGGGAWPGSVDQWRGRELEPAEWGRLDPRTRWRPSRTSSSGLRKPVLRRAGPAERKIRTLRRPRARARGRSQGWAAAKPPPLSVLTRSCCCGCGCGCCCRCCHHRLACVGLSAAPAGHSLQVEPRPRPGAPSSPSSSLSSSSSSSPSS